MLTLAKELLTLAYSKPNQIAVAVRNLDSLAQNIRESGVAIRIAGQYIKRLQLHVLTIRY